MQRSLEPQIVAVFGMFLDFMHIRREIINEVINHFLKREIFIMKVGRVLSGAHKGEGASNCGNSCCLSGLTSFMEAVRSLITRWELLMLFIPS